jgi:pimeloyl-ACP methyl ester carboxylesterase
MKEIDVAAGIGRVLHAYDRGGGDLAVLWHHGTPNIGPPPAPLFAQADRLGIRFVGYDRPGYGGSTPVPGRDVASAAADVALVVDALGIDRFAVLGHSGGGPHALACAALLPDRVTAAAVISALAPYEGNKYYEGDKPYEGDRHQEEDWFAGMGPSGAASLRASLAGPAAKAAYEATGPAPDFLPADWQALDGEWGWFGSVVEPAMAAGPAPLMADDLAYVSPWGFDPATISVPVLLVHGTGDLVVPAAHSRRLARRIPGAELHQIPGAGHISVLPATGAEPLAWLAAR